MMRGRKAPYHALTIGDMRVCFLCFTSSSGLEEKRKNMAAILFGCAIQALLAVIIMLTINPLITLVVFVPLAGSSLLMKRMTGRIQKYHHESRKAAGEVSSFIGEMFHTTQAIQLANAQLRVIAHLRQLNDARRHTRLRSFFL